MCEHATHICDGIDFEGEEVEEEGDIEKEEDTHDQ